jgi:hypothetical protein
MKQLLVEHKRQFATSNEKIPTEWGKSELKAMHILVQICESYY